MIEEVEEIEPMDTERERERARGRASEELELGDVKT